MNRCSRWKKPRTKEPLQRHEEVETHRPTTNRDMDRKMPSGLMNPGFCCDTLRDSRHIWKQSTKTSQPLHPVDAAGCRYWKTRPTRRSTRLWAALDNFVFLTIDQMVVCNVKEVTVVECYHLCPLHFASTSILMSILSLIYWFKAPLLNLSIYAVTDIQIFIF